VICEDVEIGDGTTVGSHSFVGRGVKIGRNVKIQSFFFVGHQGAIIEDECFIGPRVTCCNVSRPRAFRKSEPQGVLIKRGATIGAGVILLPGITIGEYALVGAGSIVTHDVEPFVLAFGVPARARGVVKP